MPTYGRRKYGTTGHAIRVTADGSPEYKAGGVTVDWTTFGAESADRTLSDGTVISTGQRGIELGTVLAKITASGLYGPFSSTATDGRQTLARGSCFIVDETWLQNNPVGLGTGATDHPAVLEGGRVFSARLRMGGANPASIGGNQPTRVQVEAAFPRLRFIDDL